MYTLVQYIHTLEHVQWRLQYAYYTVDWHTVLIAQYWKLCNPVQFSQNTVTGSPCCVYIDELIFLISQLFFFFGQCVCMWHQQSLCTSLLVTFTRPVIENIGDSYQYCQYTVKVQEYHVSTLYIYQYIYCI